MSDKSDLSARTGGNDLFVPAYVPSPEPTALWDHELVPERTEWRPHSDEELWHQVLPWKCEQVTARLDGDQVQVVELSTKCPHG
jgi:hypothetical protein